LPGSAMSLGSMFKMLSSSGILNQITSKMPPEVAGALQSISGLITETELSSDYGFMVSGRVEPETFLKNATDILSRSASIGDIVDGLNRLTYDDSLHGLDKLEPVKITTQTAYGNVTISIDYTGSTNETVNVNAIIASANANTANSNTANVVANTVSNISDPKEKKDAQDLIKSVLGFISMLSSAETAFTASGRNLFGESAPRMMDIFSRLNQGGTSHMKQLIETVNIGSKEVNNLKPMAEKLIKGGIPTLSDKGFS